MTLLNNKTLEDDLRTLTEAEVLFDDLSRGIYSIDASIYELPPTGIVRPRHQKDLYDIVHIAKKTNTPIIPRGAGTGIAGGCIGRGLVVDTSKYLKNILEVNWDEEWVRVEPGVVQEELNQFLGQKGFRLGPDTSTGNRATIGGMVGNNSSGAHSLRYGKMVDHVLEITLIIPEGEKLVFSSIDEATWKEKLKLDNAEGRIYRCFEEILSHDSDLIREKFPKISRRVAGYNLDRLLSGFPLNLSSLITGSEGGFGIISEVKLKISKKPQHVGLCILHFNDLVESLKPMEFYLSVDAYAVEMIDEMIIRAARSSPTMKGKIDWMVADPKALLVIEFDADDRESLQKKMDQFTKTSQELHLGYACIQTSDAQGMKDVWALRKSGLGLLLSKRSYSRAIGFLEDIAVPPLKLAEFMEEFKTLLKQVGKESGIYGHAGEGCIHLRPFIDLRDPQEVALMVKMMNEVSDRLLDYGGTLTGEHGDGLVRSWLNEKMFGTQIYQIFKKIKLAFDPLSLANPGKVVDGPPFTQDLKLHPKSHLSFPKPFLNFDQEGGIELAIDLCNGNGECRKKDSLMCPSYQATLDEKHLTRGRAQSLRSILHGRVDKIFWTSRELYDVMDLCLECKGCKTQCPSQVDMAKLKSEFLYQYQEKHGYSIRSRIFSSIAQTNKVMSLFPQLFNWMIESFLFKWMMKQLKISTQRTLPHLAEKKFSVLYIPKHNSENQVALFVDTFTEFNIPHIGLAAARVLEKLGFNVILVNKKCCGRPSLSKGFLKEAQNQALALVHQLKPYAEKKIPIIGLEPSCLLTIVDDYGSLVPKEDIAFIRPYLCLFDEFVARYVEKLPSQVLESAHFHVHCYQKSLQGGVHTSKILSKLAKEKCEIPSGCCGMAGSFGYEEEHYDLSIKIGELVLFPHVRKMASTTPLVANGFSCRQQITHGTGKTPLHLAELLDSVL